MAKLRLKPCPKCGAKQCDAFQSTDGVYLRVPINTAVGARNGYVKCSPCGFVGPHSSNEDDAASLWNALQRKKSPTAEWLKEAMR